jgi:uncharacterized RDD family membrane protein YckC
MSDPEPTPSEPTPNNVLDSVLSDGGPMPSARLGIRTLAFLLDFVLLTAVATILIWKIAMPQAHPGAFAEFNQWSLEFVNWLSDSDAQSDSAPPQWSEALGQALVYARDLQLLIFWLYFAIGEAFCGGRSLGKLACRLRSVSTITLAPPPIMAGIVRGGLKTIALFFAFPVALIATIGALFFNQRRQLGHDLLSRTAVIDEKYLNLNGKPPPPFTN